MGAQAFRHTAEGTSIREVFDRLVQDAIYEHGDRSYNGTISTCGLAGRAKKTFSEYNPDNIDVANAIIERDDYGEKWTASWIDLGVCRYEVRTVKKKTKKPTAEFKMQHCVYQYGDTHKDKKLLAHKDTKKAADDVALKYALEGKCVTVEKDYIKLKGDPTETDFEVTVKNYTKKPNLKPVEGRTIVAIHKYILYGWASC